MEYNSIAVGFRKGNTITVTSDDFVMDFVLGGYDVRTPDGEERKYLTVELTEKMFRMNNYIDVEDGSWGGYSPVEIYEWVIGFANFDDSQKEYIQNAINFVYGI